MRKTLIAVPLAAIALIALGAGPASGAAATAGASGKGKRVKFTVTVQNRSTATTLQTSQGPKPIPLSPGAFAVYRGDNALFRSGRRADEGTERIAEDGFLEPELASLIGRRRVRDGGFFAQSGGPLGPALEPGTRTSFSFRARPGDRFSLETMFVQSNDWFYGFGGDGVSLFRPNGRPISGNLTRRLALYDAGTEVNEEPGAGTTQKPNQGLTDQDVGPSESEPVRRVSAIGDGFTVPPTSDVIRVTITAGR
jgi:hypothetical protein